MIREERLRQAGLERVHGERKQRLLKARGINNTRNDSQLRAVNGREYYHSSWQNNLAMNGVETRVFPHTGTETLRSTARAVAGAFLKHLCKNI